MGTRPTPPGAAPRQGRAGAAVVVAWFLLVIGGPLAAFASGLRPAPVENRAPAPAPGFRADRVLDTHLYEQVGDWFEDRLPGRDHAVEADAWIDYRVFGDSPSPRVSLGAGGWLFLTGGVRAACITPERAGEVAGELALAERVAAAAGVRLLLVVAPDKAAVYPDRLGGLAGEAACARQNRALLRAALAGSPGFVDTWAALEAARAADGGLLYHRTDTHWTRLGAAVAAGGVVERLVPGLWNPEAVVRSGTQQRHGDLVALMGLSFREEAANHRVWRGAGPDVVRVPTGGPEAVVSQMTGLPVVPGRAVLIHDSMGEVLVPLLRPYFEHLTSVRTRAGSSFGIEGDWFDDLLGESDVLLLQTVERELVDRFDGTVVPRMVAALADRIPHVEVAAGAGAVVPLRLDPSAAPRFLVVYGGGGASLRAGEAYVEAPAAGRATVLDVTGLAGPAVLTAEVAPTRLVLVTLPWDDR